MEHEGDAVWSMVRDARDPAVELKQFPSRIQFESKPDQVDHTKSKLR